MLHKKHTRNLHKKYLATYRVTTIRGSCEQILYIATSQLLELRARNPPPNYCIHEKFSVGSYIGSINFIENVWDNPASIKSQLKHSDNLHDVDYHCALDEILSMQYHLKRSRWSRSTQYSYRPKIFRVY